MRGEDDGVVPPTTALLCPPSSPRAEQGIAADRPKTAGGRIPAFGAET